MTRKQRFEKILEFFSKHNPQAETELVYTNPYELIVSVILSAQCTDKRVNMTTPALFKKFPDVHSLANSTPEKVFPISRLYTFSADLGLNFKREENKKGWSGFVIPTKEQLDL